ncbi:MAG: hypothetical protein AAF208_12770, partial [Cyanobacteria bacterium P01_A01_bin.45]
MTKHGCIYLKIDLRIDFQIYFQVNLLSGNEGMLFGLTVASLKRLESEGASWADSYALDKVGLKGEDMRRDTQDRLDRA